MRAYLCAQYSPAWWELRAGVPTASEFDRIITGLGKVSQQQDGYIKQLVEETRNPSGNAFTESGKRIGTPAMEAGRLTEPEARAFYCFHVNAAVQEVGFVLSECGRFGCSPDGLVDARLRKNHEYGGPWEATAEGGLELKCPLVTTQQKYLKRPAELPNCYRPQVHGQLLVTGLPWIDFLSYAEGCDPVYVRTVPDDYTALMKVELEKFLIRYHAALVAEGLAQPELVS
jgi:hypothetical protein